MQHPNAKRFFDLACCGLGLVVLAPLGLLIGLAVKLSDHGPVLFGQVRIGQFGKPFRMWKFRSMVVNAEQLGTAVTGGDDPRITRVGRWLRRSKLDELPQLWNVLAGDMSLVGPRPEVPRYVERYTAAQRECLKLKPGVTDVASLLFRHEETLLVGATDPEEFYLRYCLPKKIDLNLDYAHRANLAQDIWVIFQTVLPRWAGVLGIYTLCLGFSFWLSVQLKSDFTPNSAELKEFWDSLAWMVGPQLLLLVWRGEMRGLLSYFSFPEVRRTASALAMALVMQVFIGYALQGQVRPGASVLLMDFILSFFILCGVRTALRITREQSNRPVDSGCATLQRVALIGTGELATNLLLEFARSQHRTRRVVAFFDDDPRTWHKRPHDIPVIGMPECLLNREWLRRLDEVIVTLPKENASRICEITEMLKDAPLKVIVASGWPVLRAA